MLALKSMSLEGVSHGKTITLRVQMGQDQKEEIYFWNTSSRSYGTYLKYFLNAVISDILGVLTYLTLVGKKENKFHAATEQGINWMAGICAPCFYFFFLACWGYLCIYDFLEEARGLVLALCVCQTEWETQQVCTWVSLLATRWAAEVFWTEKDDFHHEREFIDSLFVSSVL